MIKTSKLTQKPYITFVGSLRVDCKDKIRLDQLKKDLGQTFHKTNENLLDEQCDDVLIISPKSKTNTHFYVHINLINIKSSTICFKGGTYSSKTGYCYLKINTK